MTPEELHDRIKRLKGETVSLKEYWSTFISETDVPPDRQFTVWINRYGFDVATASLEAMVDRLSRWLHNPDEKPVDMERLVTYASGIMKRKSNDA
jgi:hypothetical protein